MTQFNEKKKRRGRNKMANKETVQVFLDEDYFADKKLQMSEEERREQTAKWMKLYKFVRDNLVVTGKISTITWHRWTNVMFAKYNNWRHELMMPSKFNDMMGTKPPSLRFFKNAGKKIYAALKELQEQCVSQQQSETEKGK